MANWEEMFGQTAFPESRILSPLEKGGVES
jgi:hypothetical protein